MTINEIKATLVYFETLINAIFAAMSCYDTDRRNLLKSVDALLRPHGLVNLSNENVLEIILYGHDLLIQIRKFTRQLYVIVICIMQSLSFRYVFSVELLC